MLNILKDNNPLLLTPCDPIEDPIEYADLAKDMVYTMYANGGIGLAANQVGVSKLLLIVQLKPSYYVIMYNPEIIWQSNKNSVDMEGCLSYPGKAAKVGRKLKVGVKYQDVTGSWNTIQLEALPARVLQHELDHLNGITMFDKEIK